MSIEMVRIPSETPNISNIDDFVGLRYAYGNQSGYVIDKGNECSYTINGFIFKINSGRLVLQGVEVDIDANGVEIAIDNVATTRYYTVYLQINLALNETKILATYDTATYPAIDIGDDLTKNTIGTGRLELYRFDAINGVISNVVKKVEKIVYLKNFKVENSFNSDNSEKINGLELKKNDENSLVINSEIISRKIILWEGSKTNTDGKFNIGQTLKNGDKLEVIVSIYNSIVKIPYIFIFTPNIDNATKQELNIGTFQTMKLAVNFYSFILLISTTGEISLTESYYKQLGSTTGSETGTSGIYQISKIIE